MPSVEGDPVRVTRLPDDHPFLMGWAEIAERYRTRHLMLKEEDRDDRFIIPQWRMDMLYQDADVCASEDGVDPAQYRASIDRSFRVYPDMSLSKMTTGSDSVYAPAPPQPNRAQRRAARRNRS